MGQIILNGIMVVLILFGTALLRGREIDRNSSNTHIADIK